MTEMDRRVPALVIVSTDHSWHSARIPTKTMENLLKIKQQGGGDWRGEVLFRDDCKYGNLDRVDIDDLLVEQKFVTIEYTGGIISFN